MGLHLRGDQYEEFSREGMSLSPCCNIAPPWSGEGLDLCGDQYEQYDQSGECEEVHLEGRACRHVATMRPPGLGRV